MEEIETARRDRGKKKIAASEIQAEPKEDNEIPEKLMEQALSLFEIGVREQKIVGILQTDSKTLVKVRNKLIEERKINKRRN